MTDIRIDKPGAGEWIMARVGGVFTPTHSHSFSRHNLDSGMIRGGFVLEQYLGASAHVHMAGDDKRWINRELLWVFFTYTFKQLGCSKIIVPMPSRERGAVSLSIQLRLGMRVEATIEDGYAPGVHMLFLTMSRDTCRWLDYKPREWRYNREAA